MSFRTHLLTCILCAALTTGACGTESLSSGLAQEASLATLDAAGARVLCETSTDALAVLGADICVTVGVMTIQTSVESCEQAMLACESETAQNLDGQVDAAKSSCDAISAIEVVGASCTATVGEWEACLNENIDMYRDAMARFSCADDPEEAAASPDMPNCDAYRAQGCTMPLASSGG